MLKKNAPKFSAAELAALVSIVVMMGFCSIWTVHALRSWWVHS